LLSPVCSTSTSTDGKYRPTKYPRVLEGEGYGIVENCGGVYRLADVAEAYKKKRGREYREFREWLGVSDLDMSAFDRKDMNFRLSSRKSLRSMK